MEQISLIEQTKAALKKNGFLVEHFPNSNEAVTWILEQVEAGQTVAFGGSMTLRQLDLHQKLVDKGLTLLDHWRLGITPEEQKKSMLKAFSADAYFSSSNAITGEGWLLNVDGRGNRIAALCYGPEKVFIVAGINKICPNITAAHKRLQNQAAPPNAKRLGYTTPCTEDGVCHNCPLPGRICRGYLTQRHPMRGCQMTIVLIDEELGF